MARILYLDCFSGASGDMIAGALLDAGAPFDALSGVVDSLDLDGVNVSRERVDRSGVGAAKFRVATAGGGQDQGHGPSPAHDHDRGDTDAHMHDHTHGNDHHHGHGHARGHAHDHDHAHDRAHAGDDAHGHDEAGRTGRHAHPHHRGLEEIVGIVDRSALSPAGKARAAGLFRRLAEVEADIHQVPVETVHLHEVGAADSIVDVVAAVWALEWLRADRVVASPLNVGSGTVSCEHGELPVPAPATARLLAGAPIYAAGPAVELVTPTGALIVTEYADAFGPLPPMRLERIGYGAGDRDLPGRPNVLRVFLGEQTAAGELERVAVIECQIDDMNPQIYGVLMDRLVAAGAHDVFYTPIQMKKNRPGTLVTVLAPLGRREPLCEILFGESTTIGLRVTETLRERLDRETVAVETPVGVVRVKIARRGGKELNAAPEFEDCARLAAERGLPVRQVQAIAVKAWLDRNAATTG